MSDASRVVRFFFDFVSPYSYLALARAEDFALAHGVRWELRPVVYAVLLDRTGLVGPAEVPIKRKYTFRDILRAAQMLELPLVGPPHHPFRSLEALRTVLLFEEHPKMLPLAVHMSAACWGEGRDLTDLDTLCQLVDECGLPSDGLAERLAAPAVKQRLCETTEEALVAGVFGVPTFKWKDELFWGHDRLRHLAAAMGGEFDDDAGRAELMDRRPRGADRPGVADRFADPTSAAVPSLGAEGGEGVRSRGATGRDPAGERRD